MVAAKDAKQWATNLSVVRGKIYNYYAEGDKTLYMFKSITLTKPIGMVPLLEVPPKLNMSEEEKAKDAKFKELAKNLRIVNFNYSNLSSEVNEEDSEFSRILSFCDL